jgi:hypothetical protein
MNVTFFLPGSTGPAANVYYMAYYYDAADRETAS